MLMPLPEQKSSGRLLTSRMSSIRVSAQKPPPRGFPLRSSWGANGRGLVARSQANSASRSATGRVHQSRSSSTSADRPCLVVIKRDLLLSYSDGCVTKLQAINWQIANFSASLMDRKVTTLGAVVLTLRHGEEMR